LKKEGLVKIGVEEKKPYTEEDHNYIRVVRKREVTRMPLNVEIKKEGCRVRHSDWFRAFLSF